MPSFGKLAISGPKIDIFEVFSDIISLDFSEISPDDRHWKAV